MIKILHALFSMLIGLSALIFIPATAAVTEQQPYVIGAGDTVDITVFSRPELASKSRVNVDNSVLMPLIGRVQIGGQTIIQSERLVEQMLKKGDFVKDPIVRVDIANFDSQKISVLGRVGLPGLIVLDRTTTLTEILARVGGIAEDGGDYIQITRSKADGTAELKRIEVAKLFNQDGGSTNMVVQNGDVIYVPKAANFYVLGAVARSGNFRLVTNLTVHQALAMSGGLTPAGTENGVTIRRQGRDKNISLVKADKDTLVQENDVIIFKERIF